MIEIEKDIPISHQSKYDEYIKAMIDMKSGESFLTDSYKIVDAVRGYAWRKGHKITFRTIKKFGQKKEYRIWKL